MDRIARPLFAVTLGLSLLLAGAQAMAQGTPGGGIIVPGSDTSGSKTQLKPKDDKEPGPGGDVGSGGASPDQGPSRDDKKTDEPGRSLEMRIKSVEQRLEEARGQIRSLRAQVAANARAIEELRMLLEEDRDSELKPGQSLMGLDVDCGEDKDMNCEYCLGQYEDKFRGLTLNFERLRVIYARYKRNHDLAINIGDSLAGFHGASSLAWTNVKIGMERSLQQLQRAYDDKFKEFMDNYRQWTRDIQVCLPKDHPNVADSLSARSLANKLTITYKRPD